MCEMKPPSGCSGARHVRRAPGGTVTANRTGRRRSASSGCRDAPRMHHTLLRVLAVLSITAAAHSPPVLAGVIDDIAIERHGPGARVRLRLTGPVHYIRDYSSANGDSVNVHLQALAPENFGDRSAPDEVKRSPESALVPRFTVRVTLDPRCDPAPQPVCIVIRFDRPVRHRIRLGEDRRSLLLDLPLVSDGQGGPPTAREKP